MLSFSQPQSWSSFADLSSRLLAGARWGHFSSAPTLCCKPAHTASPAPTDSYKKPRQLATSQLRKTLSASPSSLQLLLPQCFRGSANAIRSDPFFLSMFRLEDSTPASPPWLTQLWVAGDVARLSSLQLYITQSRILVQCNTVYGKRLDSFCPSPSMTWGHWTPILH